MRANKRVRDPRRRPKSDLRFVLRDNDGVFRATTAHPVTDGRHFAVNRDQDLSVMTVQLRNITNAELNAPGEAKIPVPQAARA